MERMHTEDPNGSKLDGLFAAYRDACPDPETGPDFMPKLWSKIEARRVETTTSIFKRLAQVCMAATAALVILSAMLTPPSQEDEILFSSTYTEVLAADHADRAYVQTLPADLPGDVR
jgi:hypothetical protein